MKHPGTLSLRQGSFLAVLNPRSVAPIEIGDYPKSDALIELRDLDEVKRRWEA